MKLGLILLVITTSLCIFAGVGWRKASAENGLEKRIVQAHESIIALREQKQNDCLALGIAMPYYLLEICGEPLPITE